MEDLDDGDDFKDEPSVIIEGMEVTEKGAPPQPPSQDAPVDLAHASTLQAPAQQPVLAPGMASVQPGPPMSGAQRTPLPGMPQASVGQAPVGQAPVGQTMPPVVTPVGGMRPMAQAPMSMAAPAPMRAAGVHSTPVPTMPPMLPLHEEPEEHTELVASPGTRADWRVTAIVGTVAALLGLGSGYLIWGGGESGATAVSATPAVANATAGAADVKGNTVKGNTGKSPPVKPTTDPAVATDPDKPGDDQASGTVAPAVGDGECEVQLESTPSKAKVTVGKRTLGVTPLTAAVPCGKTRFRFSRRRYDSRSARATLVAGETKKVSIKLDRPDVKLSVSSSPRGAEIQINGKRVGKTPATVEVSGYVRTVVTLKKRGYKTYTTKIYPKPPKSKVRTKLKRR